jgi:hypothetical protein
MTACRETDEKSSRSSGKGREQLGLKRSEAVSGVQRMAADMVTVG